MHNYLKKLDKMRREGKFPVESGKQYSAKVSHDSWCQVYDGGECNCDPDISFVEVTAQNVDQVATEVAENTKEFKEEIKKRVV